MRIAMHQPNFIPHFPFFEKMYQSDIFVILKEVQFEKNGFQNRAKINNKWWTNPVRDGLVPIKDKDYANGYWLLDLNMKWINVMAETLGINTKKIHFDFLTKKKGTERIVEICKVFGADEYLTNPEAIDKYLNAKLLEDNDIKIVPFVSKNRKHVFELFAEIGIEGTRNLLRK